MSSFFLRDPLHRRDGLANVNEDLQTCEEYPQHVDRRRWRFHADGAYLPSLRESLSLKCEFAHSERTSQGLVNERTCSYWKIV
jgi:hypothetical protein